MENNILRTYLGRILFKSEDGQWSKYFNRLVLLQINSK